ncbi:MAG TPA: enoyl-CoA hydratase/isomerase family protein [Stellaceae bacterium]|nr:enoyl-CoA hydratase/isomerase family protein [Stellaceae bacterium]
MTPSPTTDTDIAALLRQAGLLERGGAEWLDATPQPIDAYERDSAAFARFWQLGDALLDKLPAKEAAASAVIAACRSARDRFLAAHVERVYRAITNDLKAFIRVEHLVREAARAVPGLVPAPELLAAENVRAHKDKHGIEIDHGIFLNHALAHPIAGAHLCHAMLLPRPEALDRLDELRSRGAIELATATVERSGRAAIVTLRNPRFLNAEDETTLEDSEIAIDLATLDPLSEVAVLRGGVVEHPKYAGRRLFSAGINLTHLYRGQIPFVWYLQRDLGLVNKIFRGLARADESPDELSGGTIEKPWIAAVDGFAIGGGCQILLAIDYVIAASDAYLTLPARKEGIIPGAANLRLPRFVGDRIARQAILYGRRLDCASAEGRLICDEVAAPDAMDTAVEQAIAGLSDSGVVSAAGNRRALRVGQEPLDLFRRYMAVYAREQAYCHFSPALIANLERYWNAAQRRV